MLHQKEILEWLKMFNVNQIKHFLTIKNPTYQEFIRRILTHRECKPKERMMHGYCEQKIKDEAKTIYLRDSYRYKAKKQEKKEVDQMFFQNITASRFNAYSLSVKKEFIKNGKLSECMLILSDNQIFNCITSNYQDSAWFQISNINSFSMWIVRSFELEIFQAYYAHQTAHAVNHYVFAEQCLTRERVKEMLDAIIMSHLQKSHKLRQNKPESNLEKVEEERLQISKEEAPYLLQKCMQKFEQEGRDLGQIAFQEVWSVADPSNKVYKLFRELQEKLMTQYNDYLLDLKCQEIQSYSNSKKKKKRTKKSKEECSQLLESNDNKYEQEIKVEHKHEEHKQASKQQESKVEQTPQQHKKQEQSTLKDATLNRTLLKVPKQQDKKLKQIKVIQVQKKVENNLPPRKSSKTIKESLPSPIIESQEKNLLKLNEQKQKQQQKKAKKVVNDRINEYILSFYQQLHESSQNFDRYRKLCYEIIRNTIEELKITEYWSLQLFGSSSIDFALKESDLDLVLIIENEKTCTLNDLYLLFKAKEWLIDCNEIPAAKVPIVQFEVLLSQLKHPKSKENKKISNSVIHVDISISYRKLPHEGLKNTSFLKEIFESHPNLMTICLILKQLLRVNGLNKPYRGGISSYILVILTHNILKFKNIDFCDSLISQIKAVAKYLTAQFEPFATLVTPYKNSKLKPNSELSLNIEDPHENVLLHTSARLINEIIALFKQLHTTLEHIENEMTIINVQQRKKMKRIFFENWSTLFSCEPEECERQ